MGKVSKSIKKMSNGGGDLDYETRQPKHVGEKTHGRQS